MKTTLALLFALLLAPTAFATCSYSPRGYVGFYYDHIANGGPVTDDYDCWTPTNATFTTNSVCGSTIKSYQFGYAGSISQTVNVPSNMTGTYFTIAYELQFEDPHNDGTNNELQVSVYDLTTYTQRASDYYDGSMADVSCSPRSVAFNGTNLAGHTLIVTFSGSTGYSDTIIRVRFISLWQHS
ncbi:MAG TPA: hypothetical protein VJ276_13270 [Thermoanaerobaculia bacterium]|nr:hypothetical protein [Thermoanaerobaculia bacterium]